MRDATAVNEARNASLQSHAHALGVALQKLGTHTIDYEIQAGATSTSREESHSIQYATICGQLDALQARYSDHVAQDARLHSHAHDVGKILQTLGDHVVDYEQHHARLGEDRQAKHFDRHFNLEGQLDAYREQQTANAVQGVEVHRCTHDLWAALQRLATSVDASLRDRATLSDSLANTNLEHHYSIQGRIDALRQQHLAEVVQRSRSANLKTRQQLPSTRCIRRCNRTSNALSFAGGLLH